MSETLVQRPTPVDMGPRPAMPQHEVIDLDDWVDNIIDLTPSPRLATRERRAPRSPEVIDVDEQYGDVEVVAGPSRPAARANRPLDHSRPQPIQLDLISDLDETFRLPRSTVFSPSPPPPEHHPTPPIPPLPRFRQRRIHPPVNIAGALRPLEVPYPFEENAGPVNVPQPPRPYRPHAPRPRPRPRVTSNIGLGGALLALNRQNELLAMHARHREEQRLAIRHAREMRHAEAAREGNAWGWMNPVRNAIQGWWRQEEHDGEEDMLLQALALSAVEAGNAFSPDRQAAPSAIPDFIPQYTHPSKPPPGFTTDFSTAQEPIHVSDKPGSSSSTTSEADTILVCAKCLDPLVINVVGSEEIVQKSKVWALRCGHMFDGKCIDTTMKPIAILDFADDAGPPTMDRKGKGKAKAIDLSFKLLVDEQGQASLTEGLSTVSDILHEIEQPSTGKRKASELNAGEDGEAAQAPLFPYSNASPMRSRLRPRISRAIADSAVTGQASPHNTTILPPGLQDVTSTSDISSSAPQRNGHGRAARRGAATAPNRALKGKGKGKANTVSVQVIEAEYEWLCPVVGCNQKHFSVKINGEWRMDAERGAISVYA